MTVPAGTDWTAALNDNGWAGFKNVGMCGIFNSFDI
jgi:hypothetical protein